MKKRSTVSSAVAHLVLVRPIYTLRRFLIVVFLVTGPFIVAAATVSPPPPDVTRLVVHAPRPEYPERAVQRGAVGTGVYLLRVQIKSGVVTQVIVGRSAGHGPLDAAAVKTLRTWRFKPGAVPYRKITSIPLSPPQTKNETLVKVPVTFGP
jgi:TonB family protein